MKDLINEYLDELDGAATNTRFSRLLTICTEVFGEPRIKGSHHRFKTPWQGEPMVNLQKDKGGKAKPYQVRQVIDALQMML